MSAVLSLLFDAARARRYQQRCEQLKFTRFLACARNKLWWMTPEWGASLSSLPPETQFLLAELPPGGTGSTQRYALLLPLIDGDFRGTLRPNRCVSRARIGFLFRGC